MAQPPSLKPRESLEEVPMATEKAQNVQDVFLNTLRKKKMPVTVFLSSGVKLQGNITGFDNFCVVLRRGPQVQLVYKHSIATVVPSASMRKTAWMMRPPHRQWRRLCGSAYRLRGLSRPHPHFRADSPRKSRI